MKGKRIPINVQITGAGPFFIPSLPLGPVSEPQPAPANRSE